MLERFSTNATVAKIRSIYGSMLTAEDFHEMVSKRSVAEIADYLAATKRFSRALRDIDVNTVHRGYLESRLVRSTFETYIRLTAFQGLDRKPFYDFLIKKYECRQLISLVNAVNNGLNDSFIATLPSYMFKRRRINLISLAKYTDIPSLTSALKGTEYYKVFRSFKLSEDGKADITDAEIKLRINYFTNLLKSVDESFFGSERDEMEMIIKREVDIINMINAYRMKAYFGYTPDEIMKSSLPFTQCGRSAMNRVFNSEDPQSMLSEIRKSTYGRMMTDDEDSIETGMSRRALDYMRRTLVSSTSTPAALYSFMYICEEELKNIVRIIEGVRYDVEPAMIDKLLVL